MHPADIKALIAKAGSSQASIAAVLSRREGGGTVSQAAVHHVIYARSKSHRIASEIARVTGRPVSDLWPGIYPRLEFLEKAGRTKAGRTEIAAAHALAQKARADAPEPVLLRDASSAREDNGRRQAERRQAERRRGMRLEADERALTERRGLADRRQQGPR